MAVHRDQQVMMGLNIGPILRIKPRSIACKTSALLIALSLQTQIRPDFWKPKEFFLFRNSSVNQDMCKITIPDGSRGYLSEKLEEETQLL